MITLWYVYVFLFGLIVGSFVNVVIWRFPRSQGLGGRSHCTSCSIKIPWYGLVPVVSFLLLGGRCRQCKARISLRYPLVEFYSGMIFLGSFLIFGRFGLGHWLFAIFVLEILLILGVIDSFHMILPDAFVALIAAGAVVLFIWQRPFFGGGSDVFRIYAATHNVIGAAVLFLIIFFPWLMSGGKWIGLGDAKLAGAIGLLFGPKGSAIILYGAIASGALVGLTLLLTRRATSKSRLPLGAFICIWASLYIFAGPWLVRLADNYLMVIFPTLYI